MTVMTDEHTQEWHNENPRRKPYNYGGTTWCALMSVRKRMVITMAKQPYKYETARGVLLTHRKYKPRDASGIVGEVTLKLTFSAPEMAEMMKHLDTEVFDDNTVSSEIFKKISGKDIGREAKQVVSEESMTKYVSGIEKVLKAEPNISPADFDTRLTAMADKHRLTTAQVSFLKKRFPLAQSESDDDIEF